MDKANLIRFNVTRVEFNNDIKEQKKIELGFNYSYSVKYSKQNTCVGEFTANVEDKNNKAEFAIKVVGTAAFTFEHGAKKEELHLETYNQMFPYIRAFITSLTSSAGMPPIIAPVIDISNKEIYRFEMGKDGNPVSPDDFVNPYAED